MKRNRSVRTFTLATAAIRWLNALKQRPSPAYFAERLELYAGREERLEGSNDQAAKRAARDNTAAMKAFLRKAPAQYRKDVSAHKAWLKRADKKFLDTLQCKQ